MEWNHTQTCRQSGISLHDCRAERLEAGDNRLEFTFENGFTLTADNEHNPTGRACRTGRSSLVIRGCELETIFYFREYRLFRKPLLTVRKSITPDELARKLNSSKWQLEFITEYVSAFTVMYICDIWFDRKPYHMECQLEAVFEDIEYNWNSIADTQ